MQETQETWVQSLGWQDPLEKDMAPHSSIPAWRIPWTEEPGGLQSMGCKESDTTEPVELTCTRPPGFVAWAGECTLPSSAPSYERAPLTVRASPPAFSCWGLRFASRILRA